MRRTKGKVMQLPPFLQGNSPARLAQGAAAGAALAMLIGFNWGGWVLGSTAQKMTEDSVNHAVVAALAPICVEKFHQAAEANAKLVALKATDSWKQDTFIIKGGWATFPGEAKPNRNVAEACANILSAAK
jgi:alpha/beta superfamily hydrolase